jgi:multicomponent Na+:H+ antiporter subunit C
MVDIMTALGIALLFGIGAFQLLRRDLIKAAMGFSLLFTAVNLFILAMGAYRGQAAPYTTNVDAGQTTSDPMVQALILTAIVIGFGSYAMLLGMVNIAARRYRTVDSDEVNELRN